MGPVDDAEQEIPGKPAPIVLELRLMRECPSAERLASIIGLNEVGGGVHLAHGAHRQHDGSTLLQ